MCRRRKCRPTANQPLFVPALSQPGLRRGCLQSEHRTASPSIAVALRPIQPAPPLYNDCTFSSSAHRPGNVYTFEAIPVPIFYRGVVAGRVLITSRSVLRRKDDHRRSLSRRIARIPFVYFNIARAANVFLFLASAEVDR